MIKRDNDISSFIKLMNNEIDFYKEKNNPDWTPEKNSGFKSGLSYVRNLLKRLEKEINRV
ncbi:hypothetical protein ABC418_08635 [Lactiplantibacillus plantarum]|uniref:hypothetical protein n=1 Tax=Lactiplantibacillus plantarum TaxID=1590 RepID=UPI000CFBF2F5|nr:hypothetical protein [Lactiplantibacillus plantarum]AVK62450.1 hypothetical protein C5Z25_12080 [Lactobacillus sp. CBA3605]